MAQFRPKKLDLGCFVNIKVIRDHAKRQVFAENEAERYAPTFSAAHPSAPSHTAPAIRRIDQRLTVIALLDKLSAT